MKKLFAILFASLALIACTANASLLLTFGGGNTITLPSFATGAKIITVGDSITQVGNYSDLSYTKISNQGDSYLHWAIRDLPGYQHTIWWSSSATGGAAPPYFYGANFGLSGDTATQVAARTAEMVNIAPEIAVLMVGTNVGSTDTLPATVQASIQDILDDLHGAGTHVILGTIWPRVVSETPTGSEISPALMARIITINEWIRAQESSNVSIWDPWEDLRDQAYTTEDALYGSPATGMLRDEVHPAPLGAYTAAQSLRALLSQMIGNDQYDDTWFDSDPASASNRLLDGELAGSGGTANTGMTGTVATNWVASCASASGNVSGVASVSANSDTGGQTQRLVLTSDGLGSSTGHETCFLTPLGFRVDEPSMTNGSWVRLFAKVRVSSNTDGVLGALRVQLRNSTQNEYGHGMEHTNGTRSAEPWPTGDYDQWIISEPIQYNTSDTFLPHLYIDVLEGESGSVTIDIDGMLLREVEDPQTTFPFSS